MRLVPWKPDDLLRRLDDVVAVYGEAMGYRAELLETRRGYIAAHVRRPGFRAVATLTTDGQLAGFGYGYLSGPGQWWHDQVRSALDREARKTWLADCFEVVELHVRPTAQGHGVGARQLRALLAMADGSDRAAVHARGRRAEVPRLAAVPPVRLRRRAARLPLPRRRAGVRRAGPRAAAGPRRADDPAVARLPWLGLLACWSSPRSATR